MNIIMNTILLINNLWINDVNMKSKELVKMREAIQESERERQSLKTEKTVTTKGLETKLKQFEKVISEKEAEHELELNKLKRKIEALQAEAKAPRPVPPAAVVQVSDDTASREVQTKKVKKERTYKPKKEKSLAIDIADFIKPLIQTQSVVAEKSLVIPPVKQPIAQIESSLPKVLPVPPIDFSFDGLSPIK